MLKFKCDTSNNITFPADERKVMLLIDGEYYRMKIDKNCEFRYHNNVKQLYDAEITYLLYKEDRKGSVAQLILQLNSEMADFAHYFNKGYGFDEVPEDFFEIEKISIFDEKLRAKGIGTAMFNYAINDVIKFNKLLGKNIKVLILRRNSKVTLPFYAKFGARLNTKEKYTEFEESIPGELIPMIIDEPKIVGEVPLELADDFDYAKVGEKNPFTSSGSELGMQ